jgi:trimeric autotransporter adhesin
MFNVGRWIGLLVIMALVLTGCLDTSGTALPSYKLGGTVTGLNGPLSLFSNGTVVSITQSGPFQFPGPLSEGTPYAVVVIEEPSKQDCIVENGEGVIGRSDVTNVSVSCSEQKVFQIGGKVNGLSGKLTLRNGTDTVSVSSDGEFAFPVRVPDATPYAIGVEEEPVNQSCTIAGAVGVVKAADVTDVNVTCLVDDARLIDLDLSEGSLSPAFSPETSIYLTNVGLLLPWITVTPTAASADSIIMVNSDVVMSGSESAPIYLDLGSNVINVRVQAPSGAEREYALVVQREEKLDTTYIKASTVGADDYFGFDVVISGDLMAVSATGEDSSAVGINGNEGLNDRSASGAVYVFLRQGDTWKQEAYLKASNSDTNDFFGTSLALDGDTLVVGASGENSNANTVGGNQMNESSDNSGAVYVFVRSPMGVWTQQAYIKASNNDANDYFGAAVAISGDTLAIGAPFEDGNSVGVGGDQGNNSTVDSGAVYVYFRSGTTWQQQAYIKASNTDQYDHFGMNIALLGDTLAVGTTDEDSNTTGINPQSNEMAFEAGAAYVFTRTGTTWAQQAFIKASNAAGDDQFGAAVALGTDILVVGARNEDGGTVGIGGNQSDNSVIDSGAAYVFVRSNGTWTQDAYIKASNTDTYDYFGSSIALSGNLLAIGAFGENAGGVGLNPPEQSNTDLDSGAVYLFNRDKNGWTQAAYLKALNSDPSDEYGRSIALDGSTLVCGSRLEDGGFSGVGANPYNDSAGESGAVFVYH